MILQVRKKAVKKSADKAIEDNKKLLHPVEVFVLQQALAVLQQAEASKVVLLDIFERKTDGTINMQDKLAKTLATQKLPYEIELNWEEMQSIDDHKKTLMWLKEKQEKITSFIMDREEQNKINEILSVRGLKFKS